PPRHTLFPYTTLFRSKAQLRMEDDSIFAIPADTSFRIDQFQKATGAGTAIFSLIKGGFRTITGLIGKVSGDTYRVNARVATMGVDRKSTRLNSSHLVI